MSAAVQPAPAGTRCYQRHRPQHTLWYRTVQAHFETWLALAAASDEPHRQPMSNKRFAATSNAEFLVVVLPGPSAKSAGTTTWLPFRARARRYAPRATPGAWWRPRRISSITCCRCCRCGMGPCGTQAVALFPARRCAAARRGKRAVDRGAASANTPGRVRVVEFAILRYHFHSLSHAFHATPPPGAVSGRPQAHSWTL